MHEGLYKEAGVRIKELRKERGYSREQLAEMCEISSKFLYEIEKGKKGFSVHTLVRISKSLEVNCDYIIYGEKKDYYQLNILKFVELLKSDKRKYVEDILHIVYEMVKE